MANHTKSNNVSLGVAVAKELIASIVQAGATRHVVASTASALWRLAVQGGGDEAEQHRPEKVLHAHEEALIVVEESLGPEAGIGSVCKLLRSGGFKSVASTLSNQHRCRKVAAHPPVDFPKRLRQALEVCRDMDTPTEAGSMQAELESQATHELETVAGKHEATGGHAVLSDKAACLRKALEPEQQRIATSAVAVAPGVEKCALEGKLLGIGMGLNFMKMLQEAYDPGVPIEKAIGSDG